MWFQLLVDRSHSVWPKALLSWPHLTCGIRVDTFMGTVFAKVFWDSGIGRFFDIQGEQ
jgi:hypothetical protein